MNAADARPGLTFAWPPRDRFPVVLFACVFFSLLAHAATFLLFQVVYPQRVTIPPSGSQVSLLTASTPENEALLRWIDAEDPALGASASGLTPANLLEVPYVPSYAVVRTFPLATVEPAGSVQFPPAKPPLELIRAGERKANPPLPAPAPVATSIAFSGSLAVRVERGPAWKIAAPSEVPLEPASWLIGVEAGGEVRFIFTQRSSGNPQLDAAAAAHLERLRFIPAETPIEWSIATISWGDDAYRTPSAP